MKKVTVIEILDDIFCKITKPPDRNKTRISWGSAVPSSAKLELATYLPVASLPVETSKLFFCLVGWVWMGGVEESSLELS